MRALTIPVNSAASATHTSATAVMRVRNARAGARRTSRGNSTQTAHGVLLTVDNAPTTGPLAPSYSLTPPRVRSTAGAAASVDQSVQIPPCRLPISSLAPLPTRPRRTLDVCVAETARRTTTYPSRAEPVEDAPGGDGSS